MKVKFEAVLRRDGYAKYATETLRDTIFYDPNKTLGVEEIDDYLAGFCGNHINVVDVSIKQLVK